jgi:para-nitrobenzyl esterase
MAQFTRLLALSLFAVAASTASAQVSGCSANDPDVTCTLQGAVRGVVEGDMLAFKGIPYARPPVGPLRWKPTEAAEGWSGVRDASRFGATCPQIIGQEVKGAEDCLTVNVWRPRVKPAQALPVMVWLTGGGNHSLSGQGSAGFGGLTYSGDKFVPQDVEREFEIHSLATIIVANRDPGIGQRAYFGRKLEFGVTAVTHA